MKNCGKCGVLLELSSFRDSSLASGYGNYCNACKKIKNKKTRKRQSKSNTVSKRPLNQSKRSGLHGPSFTNTELSSYEIGKSYEIEYTNLQSKKSKRIIRIESMTHGSNSFKAYCFSKEYVLTFRADRSKIIRKL